MRSSTNDWALKKLVLCARGEAFVQSPKGFGYRFLRIIGSASAGDAIGGSEWVGSKALHCAGCAATYDLTRLQNALTLAIRKETSAYYSAPLQCDEPSCKELSRGLSTHIGRDEAGMAVLGSGLRVRLGQRPEPHDAGERDHEPKYKARHFARGRTPCPRPRLSLLLHKFSVLSLRLPLAAPASDGRTRGMADSRYRVECGTLSWVFV